MIRTTPGTILIRPKSARLSAPPHESRRPTIDAANLTKGIDLGRYVLNIVNIDPPRSLAPMTTPSDPELQTAKERLLPDVRTKILQQISDGTVKGTASDRVELNWAEAREVLRALSSLDALEAENVRLVDQRNCEAIRANHNEERAESAEAQRDKLAETSESDTAQAQITERLLEEASAARDKLAGEVERLTKARAEQERIIGEYQPRAVMAEARLSALSEACKPIVDDRHLNGTERVEAIKTLRAALNPTLPTGGEGKAADARPRVLLPNGARLERWHDHWNSGITTTSATGGVATGEEDWELVEQYRLQTLFDAYVTALAAPSKEPAQPGHAKILLDSARALRNSAADHHDWSSILTADERARMVTEAEALEAGAAALGQEPGHVDAARRASKKLNDFVSRTLTEAAKTVEEPRQDRVGPMHASAPAGCKCADCTIGGEACDTCYAAWWRPRHPNVIQHVVLPQDRRERIAKSLFYRRMTGHARWDQMADPHKEPYLLDADAILSELSNEGETL